MMILIDKKVIEELSVTNVNNIRVVNAQTLLENSKEVEVLDNDDEEIDNLYYSWQRSAGFSIDRETFGEYCDKNGYQLIKIKE